LLELFLQIRLGFVDIFYRGLDDFQCRDLLDVCRELVYFYRDDIGGAVGVRLRPLQQRFDRVFYFGLAYDSLGTSYVLPIFLGAHFYIVVHVLLFLAGGFVSIFLWLGFWLRSATWLCCVMVTCNIKFEVQHLMETRR
jgi:hypothetical protein